MNTQKQSHHKTSTSEFVETANNSQMGKKLANEGLAFPKPQTVSSDCRRTPYLSSMDIPSKTFTRKSKQNLRVLQKQPQRVAKTSLCQVSNPDYTYRKTPTES